MFIFSFSFPVVTFYSTPSLFINLHHLIFLPLLSPSPSLPLPLTLFLVSFISFACLSHFFSPFSCFFYVLPFLFHSPSPPTFSHSLSLLPFICPSPSFLFLSSLSLSPPLLSSLLSFSLPSFVPHPISRL